jgi:hypothetical protein
MRKLRPFKIDGSYNLLPIFEPIKKSLNIILLPLELQNDCKFKMAISEQFKLLNLKK